MSEKNIVQAIMQYYSFPKGTKNWQDYESAKKLIFRHYTGKRYDKIIKEITEWVGV